MSRVSRIDRLDDDESLVADDVDDRLGFGRVVGRDVAVG